MQSSSSLPMDDRQWMTDISGDQPVIIISYLLIKLQEILFFQELITWSNTQIREITF